MNDSPQLKIEPEAQTPSQPAQEQFDADDKPESHCSAGWSRNGGTVSPTGSRQAHIQSANATNKIRFHEVRSRLSRIKAAFDYLGASRETPPAGFSFLASPLWLGLWWGLLLGLILLFCGQTSKFIYIDF
jgi:hypothetical protein